MGKKSAPKEEAPDMELMEEPTPEQLAAWEQEEEDKREEQLAPYRAVARQQNEPDELIAELMFKEAMRELEA